VGGEREPDGVKGTGSGSKGVDGDQDLDDVKGTGSGRRADPGEFWLE